METAMTGKQRALEILATLSDDVTLPEIIDALEMDLSLEESLADAERGDVMTHEEVMQRFSQCSPAPSK
jgi:predicted transcriptional regulator